MKRLLACLPLLAMALMMGCHQYTPLPAGSFSLGDGIESYKLTLNGIADSSKMFYLTSKYPWSIEACPGIVCDPSSGQPGERICITTTALRTNNSLETKELGPLNFRVENTRFVGVTVWQEPAISVEGGFKSKIYVNANQGATNSLVFTSKLFGDKLNIKSQGEIEIEALPQGKSSFAVTLEALTDNTTAAERKVGEFYLDVKGDFANTVIEVWQRPAFIVGVGSVILNGQQGAESRFAMASPFEITPRTDSAAFTVESTATGEIIVVANSENSTNERCSLGYIDFVMTSSPSEIIGRVEVWQRPVKAPQTIMCYCMGTALRSDFEKNISMMKSALSQDIQGESRLLVFTQSNSVTGKIVELYYDVASGEVLEVDVAPVVDLPKVYDSQMLSSILSQMIEAAPAHKYSLLVGSHGKAWIPKSATAATATVSTMDASYYDIWKKVEGALPTRHMGDSNTARLDVSEFAEACEIVGQPLEYILFDQCLASNVEMLYELRNVTKYVVASPSEVLAEGFPYDLIMPLLLENDGVEYDLDAAANAYVDYYLSNMVGNKVSACVAVTVCSELDALAECVKRVNVAPRSESVDLVSIQAYEGLSLVNNPAHIFYDLEDAAIQMCSDVQAVEALSVQLDKTVLSRYHTPSFYSSYNGKLNEIHHYCGLTTSSPIELDDKSIYVEQWKSTEWYKATH